MVTASSHETSIGSPGLPLTKLELLETIGVISPANFSCVRYSFIHAPERLPVRAYGSKYQRPTRLPSRWTSYTAVSAW